MCLCGYQTLHFRLLESFMLFCLFHIGLNQRHVPVCHQPTPCAKWNGRKGAIDNFSLSKSLLGPSTAPVLSTVSPSAGKRPFSEELLLTVMRNSIQAGQLSSNLFFSLIATNLESQAIFDVEFVEIEWKKYICEWFAKKWRPLPRRLRHFLLGLFEKQRCPPVPPPAPAAAPWKPAAHQSRQSSFLAQQLSNDYA